MSSNIPVRRSRVVRTATQKDNENIMRSTKSVDDPVKPRSALGSRTGVLSRTTMALAASKAKAAATSSGNDIEKPNASVTKRKREVLAQTTKTTSTNATNHVYVRPRVASGPTTSLKTKDHKEAVSKVHKASVATSVTAPPSQTARHRTSSSASQARRSFGKAGSAHASQAVKVRADDAVTVDAVSSTKRDHLSRFEKAHAPAAPEEDEEVDPHDDEEEEEEEPIFKKRRTSSEAPEDPEEDFDEEQLAEQRIPRSDELPALIDEADPNGDEWDDLDAEDANDPAMVSEYVVEIFEYLREAELTTLPDPNYISGQDQLTWEIREQLLNWLIHMHYAYKLLPETLFLAVNLIDRFLSARKVSTAKLALVGIACLFIACKAEEIVSPSIRDIIARSGVEFGDAEALKAERYVLQTLEWNINFPNPMNFLRRISKADEYEITVRTVGKYLLEVACLDRRLLATPPSLQAAAAMWLARLVLGREEWTPNLAHYSSYAESAIIPVANLMINYILQPIDPESCLHKKYASKRFMKAGLYVESWVRERWSEGSKANLARDLPQIKEAICATRAEAEEEAQEQEQA